MEPSQKDTSSPVSPASVSVSLRSIDWLWTCGPFLQPSRTTHLYLLGWLERSVRTPAGIHHVNFAAIAWVFDMEHKSENIRMQLLRSPRVLIIDDIFVICLPLPGSPRGSKQKPTNFKFSFRIYHRDRRFRVCKLALFIKAAPLRPRGDLIQEDGES